MINRKENLFDLTLLVPFIIITGISLIFIYSSSNVIAYADFGNPFFFLQRQIIALSISLVACSIFLFIPLFFLFSKNNFIFLLIIQILLSLSLWEFFRLKSFKDYLKKKKRSIYYLIGIRFLV